MRIRKIDSYNSKAEGTCYGLPYNTELASSQGVAIHFWVETPFKTDRLAIALHKAINARDIVYATWSFGEPTGYWAHEDIS